MRKNMTKILYVLVKQLSIFGLPGFRALRNRVYEKHLGARGINVDNLVRIQPLHFNGSREIMIGNELHVGLGALIDLSGNMTIGDRVTLSEGAKVFTHSHAIDDCSQDWRSAPLSFSNLRVEDDVWIGANAVILSSVTRIGAGAVIAAGAVVSKDVLPLSVMAGVPAKHIRYRRVV